MHAIMVLITVTMECSAFKANRDPASVAVPDSILEISSAWQQYLSNHERMPNNMGVVRLFALAKLSVYVISMGGCIRKSGLCG